MTYDNNAVHNIVDAAPILHLSLNAPTTEATEPQFPTILPILGAMSLGTFANDEQVIYLHGSSAVRLSRLGTGQQQPEIPVCIAAALLDGLYSPWRLFLFITSWANQLLAQTTQCDKCLQA